MGRDVQSQRVVMSKAMERSRRAQQRLAAELAEIGFALPGSVVVRHMRCGKANCRCKADPRQLHGPYVQWTRRVNGKTVTRFLDPDQRERYQPWFDNARRFHALVSELEALSLATAEEAEGWSTKP
jgi:hypothetical protein